MTDNILLATVVAFLYLIWRIGREIYSGFRCIDDRTLRDFWFGKLEKDEKTRRRVIHHLGTCEKCREKLDHIRNGKPIEDHLVDD